MTEEQYDSLEPNEAYERLSAEDIDIEIRALLDSAANFSRLRSIASALSAGITGLTGADLLNETIVRFYEGRRTWPRGIHPLVVLKSAMHSIASDMRKHDALSPVDEGIALAIADVDQSTTDIRPQVHGVSTVKPEDVLSGKEQLAMVYAAVAGDEEMELLVMVWADGLRGDAAAKELEWDKSKYEAARKRLTRRLNALDPDRRPK